MIFWKGIAARRFRSHAGDDVEIYLHYQLGLKDRLELPLMVQEMAYQFTSGLSAGDLDAAATEVLGDAGTSQLKERIFDLNSGSPILSLLERRDPEGLEAAKGVFGDYFDEDEAAGQLRLHMLDEKARAAGYKARAAGYDDFNACPQNLQNSFTKIVDADCRARVFTELAKSSLPEIAEEIQAICFPVQTAQIQAA